MIEEPLLTLYAVYIHSTCIITQIISVTYVLCLFLKMWRENFWIMVAHFILAQADVGLVPSDRLCLNCLVGHVRDQLKCDGTRAETRFYILAKWTSPFKSAGASVQSTTGSWGTRISGSDAGYTMFRGSVKSTGYLLHPPVFPSLPLSCVTVCHHISTGV